ncbi:MAG: DUF6782 family putative metallopeptidase [Acidimicrobiales bacterium]
MTVVGLALGAALTSIRRRPAASPPVIAPERLVLVRPDREEPTGPITAAVDAPVAEAPLAPTRPPDAASHPEPPPPAPGRKPRAGRVLGAAIVVVLVIASVVAAVWVGNDAPAPDAPAADDSSGPEAESWAPEVAELAAFVEAERGLAFDGAIPIEFLPSADYDAEAAALAEGDDPDVALLRALGLLEGAIDGVSAGTGVIDSLAFGFYDPGRRRIVIRGDDVDVTTGATLVHELTHALQDQHFPGLFAGGDSAGQRFGSRSLVEGDALRTEYAFIDTLDREEQDEYEAALDERADDVGLPETAAALLGAPHSLGDPFVYFLQANGEDVLTDAFANPPTSAEQVLDPFRYLDADPPDLPDPPAAPAGAEVLARGDLGAVAWLAILGERIDPWQALDAVDGWRGDAYTLSRAARGLCADVLLTGDTATDTTELQSAVAGWAAAVPAVTPAVTRVGDTISMTVCDPGAGADVGLTGQGARALILPAARVFTAADELALGRSLDAAQCHADDLLRRYTLDELEAFDPPADVDDRIAAADAACAAS